MTALELKDGNWVAPLANPPAVPKGSDFGRNQTFYVALGESEVKGMKGWKTGFYSRAGLSNNDVSERLRSAGIELDPLDLLNYESPTD